ncbi:MAG: hypothetical protein ACD_35C00202G0001 [uncultured bacterium]|nr:MAG: hypothetical protein ACD_35C00202G0001 [uncultured bacterium]
MHPGEEAGSRGHKGGSLQKEKMQGLMPTIDF